MPKVISDTDTEVVIEDRPWSLALLLGALCLGSVYMAFTGLREGDTFMIIAGPAFAIGLFFAIRWTIQHVRLTLYPDGHATLWVRTAKGVTERHFAPGTLRAGLATDYNEGETHRVILLIETPDGLERLPLTKYLGGSGSHEDIVTRINAWARA